MASSRTVALDFLRRHLDDIVAEATRSLLEAVPSFSRMPSDFRSTLEGVCRGALEALCRQLEQGRADVEAIDWGDLRGFELGDILRALQLGSEIAWAWVKRAWEPAAFSPQDYIAAAELIWESHFRAANSLAREYMKQRQRSVSEFNSLLSRIRLTQDREALVRLITDGVCGSLGFRRAVFLLFEHDLLTPISAVDRLDPAWGSRVLEERKRYPISPMGGTLEARAFHGPSIEVARAEAGDSVAFLEPVAGAHYALVPVNPGGSPRGLLYVEAETLGGVIGERDREVLGSYADAVGMALENQRLYDEVVAKRKVMDHLISRANTAVEEERARIARELHDSVAQSLLKIIYSAGFALDFLKEDPRLAVDEMEEVQQRAKGCLSELREIMANLRPSSLDILGLKETIVRYAEQFEEEYAISTSVELQDLQSMPRSVELAIFRILQEELTNVRKHAKAESVTILSASSDGDLILTVEDDGVGFDPKMLPAEQASGKHLGLMAVRERVELLGGDMAIESRPGAGTRIVVRIPTITEKEV